MGQLIICGQSLPGGTCLSIKETVCYPPAHETAVKIPEVYAQTDMNASESSGVRVKTDRFRLRYDGDLQYSTSDSSPLNLFSLIRQYNFGFSSSTSPIFNDLWRDLGALNEYTNPIADISSILPANRTRMMSGQGVISGPTNIIKNAISAANTFLVVFEFNPAALRTTGAVHKLAFVDSPALTTDAERLAPLLELVEKGGTQEAGLRVPVRASGSGSSGQIISSGREDYPVQNPLIVNSSGSATVSLPAIATLGNVTRLSLTIRRVNDSHRQLGTFTRVVQATKNSAGTSLTFVFEGVNSATANYTLGGLNIPITISQSATGNDLVVTSSSGSNVHLDVRAFATTTITLNRYTAYTPHYIDHDGSEREIVEDGLMTAAGKIQSTPTNYPK